MSILHDFERRLETMVEGFFAKTFRTGLQPVELGRRLLREMESGRAVGLSQVWVPNRYLFRLSPEDRDRFQRAEGALRAELSQLAREGAAERGWALLGPPEVAFETDETLGKGEFRCEASLVEGEPERPGRPPEPETARGTGPAQHGGALFLIQSGTPTRQFPLDKEVVTVGRLADCDIAIEDPGVSRRHAEIRQGDGAFVLTDLGSTNGTRVNEARVSSRALEDGDRITLGRTVLEFRRR